MKYNARRGQFFLLDAHPPPSRHGVETEVGEDGFTPETRPQPRRELGVVHFPTKQFGTPDSPLLLAIPKVTTKVTRAGLVTACAQFRPERPEESLARSLPPRSSHLE